MEITTSYLLMHRAIEGILDGLTVGLLDGTTA